MILRRGFFASEGRKNFSRVFVARSATFHWEFRGGESRAILKMVPTQIRDCNDCGLVFLYQPRYRYGSNSERRTLDFLFSHSHLSAGSAELSPGNWPSTLLSRSAGNERTVVSLVTSQQCLIKSKRIGKNAAKILASKIIRSSLIIPGKSFFNAGKGFNDLSFNKQCTCIYSGAL